MSDKFCPRCAATNPETAEQCYQCYASLLDVAPGRPGDWEQKAKEWLALTGAGVLVLGGWLPRHLSFAAVAIGLGLIGVVLKWDSLQAKLQKLLATKASKTGEKEPPHIEIADTALTFAVGEGATAIRFEKNAHIVRVFYQINGEWREEEKLPLYFWVDLREHLKERTDADYHKGHDKGRFDWQMNERRYDISLDYEALYPQERVTIELS